MNKIIPIDKIKFRFDWQIPFCTNLLTPCGRKSTYFIDALIKSGPYANLYIEIKGRWLRDTQKLKWDWFHENHKNSELWTYSVLKKIGVFDGIK